MKHWIKNICLITVGGILYAVAMDCLLLANHIGEGGVSGLMTLGYYLFHIAPSLTNFVLNGVLLIVGWRYLDRQTVGWTCYAIAVMTVALRVFHEVRLPLHEPLVAALIGGVLMGIAIGVIMQGDGTIAGSTILARICNRYLGVATGNAMLFFDLAVALPSTMVIGWENMLLTIIELYVSAVVLNRVLARLVEKRCIMIVSDHADELAGALNQLTHRGVTLLDGHGYKSGQRKQVIYCVCERQDLTQIMTLITTIDPHAFVTLQVVRSTFTGDALQLFQ